MASVTLKKNYRCFRSLEQFYSGGPYVVSADSSFIACACDDTIKIVDSSTASVKSTIEGDSEVVTALTLSPDDKILYSASHSRQIRVWDLSSLKCLRSWKGHEGPVMGMACDASGGLLATAGADRKVQVWDILGGFCTHYFKGHKGVVTTIMFHPEPSRLLLFSGSDDCTIRIWDLTSKRCVATLERHQSTVTSFAISEDGGTLVSAGRDKVVNLWNLHDFSWKMTVPTHEAVEAVCVVGSQSSFAAYVARQPSTGKNGAPVIHFITVGERGVVRMWTSDGAVCIFEQGNSDIDVSLDKGEVKRGFTSAMLLPSNGGLLCVTADQQFFFYKPSVDANDRMCLSLNKRLVGYNEEIADMKFLGDDERFLAVATSIEHVRVYDLASMSCSYVLAGHTDIILCLDTCTSKSGKTFIVTGSKDNTVRLWEAESKKCIGIGMGHVGAVGAVAFFNKDKNCFVSGSSDRTIKVWSSDIDSEGIPNLKRKAVVAAHDKDINSLAVAPNDSLVCSGSQDRTACIWKLPNLTSVAVLKGHKRGIWSVEFSPVDQCVITASGDKTIKIWAIADGSCLKTFEGHTSSVIRASFVTRGAQFFSCGADGLVKLWTIKTNECVATYDQHDDKIWALAVGKKTEMIATGGSDALINLWQDSTSADKEEAFRKEEEGVLKSQELENAVLDTDYIKAIRIAFQLNKPHKLLDLFGKICRNEGGGDQIKKALCVLKDEEYRQLFEYVREWNTKPKFCHIAHFVLLHVFTMLPPTKILELKGMGEVLEGLIPYSQRHFTRVDRMERSIFLLDYTLTRMNVVEPEPELELELELEMDTKRCNIVDVDVDVDVNGEVIDVKEEKENEGSKVEGKSSTSKKRKVSKSGTVKKK